MGSILSLVQWLKGLTLCSWDIGKSYGFDKLRARELPYAADTAIKKKRKRKKQKERKGKKPSFSQEIYLFIYLAATPLAYGGSQARSQIGAIAAGLCLRHIHTGSKPHLRPTPQLTATPDL